MAMLALVAFLPLFASVAAGLQNKDDDSSNAPIPCSFWNGTAYTKDPPTCITVPEYSWSADCDGLNEALLNCDQNDVNSMYSWIMCNQNATVLPLLSCAAFVGATNESPFVILHSAGGCYSGWDDEVHAPSGDQADLTPEVCWEQCVALGAAENKTLVAMAYTYMLLPDGDVDEATCYCQDSCPCMADGGPGWNPLESSHSILATEFFQAAPTPLPCVCEQASFGGEPDFGDDAPACSDIDLQTIELWASNDGTCDDMQSQVLGGSGVLPCNQDETDMVFTYFNCMIAGQDEDFNELQAPALDAALNCPTFDGATDAIPSPAFDPFWYDVDCVLTGAPSTDGSGCTAECGTLTNTVETPASGGGNACPEFTTYECQPGDGDCPADCVLTEAPSTDGSGCTAECGTLTNTVETPASGGGNACPEFTTYECQPGDGDCPAAGTSGSASLGGMAVITTVCLLSYFM